MNFTAVAPVKAVPVSVTVVPTVPLLGVKLVMVGTAAAARERPANTKAMNRLARRDRNRGLLRTQNIAFVTFAYRWTTAL